MYEGICDPVMHLCLFLGDACSMFEPRPINVVRGGVDPVGIGFRPRVVEVGVVGMIADPVI